MHERRFSKVKRLLVILTVLAMSFSLGNAFAQENGLSQKVGSLAVKLAFAVEGYVVGVAGETVYIDLGQNAGIVEGVKFEVVRLDKERPFKKGEKIIGYPETEVGEIEITKVRKGMSLAKITNKIMDIQEGDKAYQKMKKVTRVAITEFTYGEEFNDFTKNVEDILYTNLIQRGMTVVEREKLEQLLEEQKISFTGMIDLATAARIGKMLGVEAVVVGTVADMGNSLDIRARLVDVEKGIAITAAQIGVVKNPTITKILGSGAKRAVHGMARPAVIKEGKEIPIEEKVFKNELWEVRLVSYRVLEDGKIKVNLVHTTDRNVTPGFSDPTKIWIQKVRKSTYLTDNLGNKYSYIDAVNMEKGEDQGEDYLHQRFPPGIPLGYSLIFSPIKQETEIFNLATAYTWVSAQMGGVAVDLGKQDIIISNIKLGE